jgi:hypothetical protein
MNRYTAIPTLACLAASLWMTACQQNESPTPLAGTDEVRSASADGTTPLFTDTFSDGGTLRVVTDESEAIHFMVQAPIGSNAEKLMAKSAQQPTLNDVYLILHPDAKAAPLELQKLSDRLMALKKKTAQTAEEQEPDVLAKSTQSAATSTLNDFLNAYCIEFHEQNFIYRPKNCAYGSYTSSVMTSKVLNSTGYFTDRSYGWNRTQWTATMAHSVNTWKPTIPPYTVMWVEWGGVYTGAAAKLSLPTGKMGEVGITAHRLIAII